MDRLEEILRERLRLADVAALAGTAARVAATFAPAEDPPREEAAERFFDPTFYDAFAVAVLESDRPEDEKLRVADLAFDLVQLPRTEHEAFAPAQAIPSHLPRFAVFLARNERATSQHLLTMIYALFQRALPGDRLAEVRGWDIILPALVPDVDDTARTLYSMLVCTYPGVYGRIPEEWFAVFLERLPGPAGQILAEALRDEDSFRKAMTRAVTASALGTVDFDVWAFKLPRGIQKAAKGYGDHP